MEWIVAVGVMFVISAVVVGLPVLLLTTFWTSRRRARPGARRPVPPVIAPVEA